LKQYFVKYLTEQSSHGNVQVHDVRLTILTHNTVPANKNGLSLNIFSTKLLWYE